LGHRLQRVHVKDFKLSDGTLAGFCDLLEGDVPWLETMQALRQVGYDRTMTAEMMPPDATLLARTSSALDRILGLG
ncbi:MAG: sugar phosphate isomerase/epimerase, partial [Lentisphaeria bacterium]|nr:sugar phosphate isomerase/epimerase [Lentisphaeria bacterium]